MGAETKINKMEKRSTQIITIQGKPDIDYGED